MKKFAIGDVHGAKLALDQVISRSGFDKEEDKLICLGDVSDGWSQVSECFEELLTYKNLIYIMGNHDIWLMNWLEYGDKPHIWTSQGGWATINSYEHIAEEKKGIIKEKHLNLLKKSKFYHEEDDRLFVHGGFNWKLDIKDQEDRDLAWDRHLWSSAIRWDLTGDSVKKYKEVFIGHTTTSREDADLKPVNYSNVWNLDQGGGWEGKLTIMDIETKEYWQSDIVRDLYKNEKGR